MLARLLTLFLTLLTLGESTLNGYVSRMNLGGCLFLVNREYTIGSDYEPEDLIMPNVRRSSSAVKMRSEAAQALEKMFAAAKEEGGFSLIAISGYRSYGTQSAIFERKVRSVGRKKALLYVAPPGASEHQLGLAMDLGCNKNTGLTGSFGDTPEGKWVAENCWRFGFIIRYKEEWTDITGYAYEPWHIRYVGAEHARAIYEADIPFEYYVEQLRQAQYALMTQEDEAI
ncbi:MAG: M15 family metallopeptidase [Clostridiales bacterium]|nr:M15 family metallopeptidase [Clostridiales bacterium]